MRLPYWIGTLHTFTGTLMFERNKTDSGLQQIAVPAEISLDDGRTLKGRFIMSAARTLYDLLNGEGQFLEFEPYGGERCWFSKASLKTVKLVNVPQAKDLSARIKDSDDPYVILGLPADAPFEDVRKTFHRLVMTYHPDRYATAVLPNEVREYLATMARRVNTAYGALEAAEHTVKIIKVQRSEAVYTSPVRA